MTWFERLLRRFGYTRLASVGLRLRGNELIARMPASERLPVRGVGIPTLETLSRPPRLLGPCGPLPPPPRRLAAGTEPGPTFDDEDTWLDATPDCAVSPGEPPLAR